MGESDPHKLDGRISSGQAGGTFAPFRHPAFRAIWIANLTTSLGATMQSVGAAWLMTDLTESHRLVAMVQVSTTLPIMLFGIFAGAIADNFDRRRVMLCAQWGMLIVSAVLSLLTYLGYMNPVLLLALTLAVGTGTALNSPAWQASVRMQVGAKDLPQAIALNTIAFNLARSVGPALGGLLISLWNVSLVFLVNAVSYIAMIGVLLGWRPQVEAPVRQPMLPAIGAGLRFCASSPPIRRILIRGAALGFGVAGYQALVPAVVRDRLHGDEIDFGLMLGSFGIGSIAAALIVAKARRRFGTEAVLGAATIAFAAAQIDLALATELVWALPATFIAGGAWVAGLTTINVAMQMRSPDNILGRCLSIYQAITFGGMAIGAWTWGAMADWKGLPFALCAAAGFLAASLILLRFLAPMPRPAEGRIDHS